jgi:selenocysteine-specific elongation factor
VAEWGWIEAERLERLTGERRPPSVGPWVVDPAVLEQARSVLRTVVADGDLDVARLSAQDRALLTTMDDVVVDGGRARLAGGEVGPTHVDHPFVALLDATPFSPPSPEEAGVDRREVRDLVRSGAVVERDGFFFSAAAVGEAARIVARVLATVPGGVPASRLREELGTTRKYLLPLLSHLDASGVTRRRGDLRIAGPRLPEVGGS